MNGRIKTVLDKVGKFAGSKKGKSILISGSAVIIAAALITTVAVNIMNRPKEIVLKQGVLSGKSVTAETSSGSEKGGNSKVGKTTSSVSGGSKAVSAAVSETGGSTSANTGGNGSSSKTGGTTAGNSSTQTVSSSPVSVAKPAGGGSSAQTPTKKQTQKSGSTGSKSTSGSGGTSSAAPVKKTKNYQGVNATRTYTNEITGIKQTVEFLGMGAGYCEVACANASINTTADMGKIHCGLGKATLSGPVSKVSNAGVARNGIDSNFILANLTTGTYTVRLTAHDGTVVARYHFTVDSKGNVA